LQNDRDLVAFVHKRAEFFYFLPGERLIHKNGGKRRLGEAPRC
jgi:hypothetical protein